MADKKETELDLVKQVFSNPAGERLIKMWYEIYNDRSSYNPAGSATDCVYFEGQRSMILTVKQLLEIKND